MTDRQESIFSDELRVINLGLEGFAEDLQHHGVDVVNVDWSPPADGNSELVEAIHTLLRNDQSVQEANQETLERFFEVEPEWIDVVPAADALPDLGPKEILHAGPDIDFERMCGPQQRGVIGACVHEGWADDFDAARKVIENGDVTISPTYDYPLVVPMSTVVSPSMPLLAVEDPTSEVRIHSTLNEGRGDVQWFGVMNDSVLDHWEWIRTVLGPALSKAVDALDRKPRVFDCVSEGLLMGDECHVRAGATTNELLNALSPGLIEADIDRSTASDVHQFIADNTLFSLNFTMAACRTAADHADGVPGSTIVTALSRNGVDFGVRVGGLNDWLIGEAPSMDQAIYYSGFSVDDSTPDIGDSSILEVLGLGGMATAAAPTTVDFVGGSIGDQLRKTDELRDITLESHPDFKIPNLSQNGSPVGIDVRRVVETGRTPFINSGVIHEDNWETGQVGAGIVQAPLDPFKNALRDLKKYYSPD